MGLHTSTYVGEYPDRAYVKIRSAEAASESVILLHGGAHTGVCYEHTPDGRVGWEQLLERNGFTVYTVDWPGVGRSGHHPEFSSLTGEALVSVFEEVLDMVQQPVHLFTHSMSGPYGWKLAEQNPEAIQTIVAVAPGPPGNIMEPTTEPFVKETDAPHLFSHDEVRENWTTTRQFPEEQFDTYYNSLVPVSPRLLNERFHYQGSQLQVRPSALDIQIYVITGEDDPRHPRGHDARIARFFQSHGVSAQHVWLPDHGIRGNGHMLMLEKNSEEILNRICNYCLS